MFGAAIVNLFGWRKSNIARRRRVLSVSIYVEHKLPSINRLTRRISKMQTLNVYVDKTRRLHLSNDDNGDDAMTKRRVRVPHRSE